MAMIASFLLSILDRLTIPWRAQEYAPEASVAINLRLQSSLLQHPPAITLFLLRSVLRPAVGANSAQLYYEHIYWPLPICKGFPIFLYPTSRAPRY